jgi:putative membrane protein
LFAAEGTLLAWNRTSVALMGFGFVVERFGLFVHLVAQRTLSALERSVTFWVGFLFMVLGIIAAIASTLQYISVLKTLTPAEIPAGYRVDLV